MHTSLSIAVCFQLSYGTPELINLGILLGMITQLHNCIAWSVPCRMTQCYSVLHTVFPILFNGDVVHWPCNVKNN